MYVVSFYMQIRLIHNGLYMPFSASLLVFRNSHVFHCFFFYKSVNLQGFGVILTKCFWSRCFMSLFVLVCCLFNCKLQGINYLGWGRES